MILELIPNVGLSKLKLGSSRDEASESLRYLGMHIENADDTIDYSCDSSIQLEFGDSGLLQYIGVTWHKSYNFHYRGVNVFNTEAKKLFNLINEYESQKSEFNDYEHVFPGQIITLWDSDEQYDRFKNESRKIWASVGVGNLEYLEGIENL